VGRNPVVHFEIGCQDGGKTLDPAVAIPRQGSVA